MKIISLLASHLFFPHFHLVLFLFDVCFWDDLMKKTLFHLYLTFKWKGKKSSQKQLYDYIHLCHVENKPVNVIIGIGEIMFRLLSAGVAYS